MPQRLAATLALVAFALCLLIGGMHAGNTFTTTVTRALAAMAGTWVIGMVLGIMAQRMLDEHVKIEREKLEKSEAKPEPQDR